MQKNLFNLFAPIDDGDVIAGAIARARKQQASWWNFYYQIFSGITPIGSNI